MKLYVVMASADKGFNWVAVSAPCQNGLLCAEHKRITTHLMEEYIAQTRTSKYRVPKKWFKVVEFKEVNL